MRIKCGGLSCRTSRGSKSKVLKFAFCIRQKNWFTKIAYLLYHTNYWDATYDFQLKVSHGISKTFNTPLASSSNWSLIDKCQVKHLMIGGDWQLICKLLESVRKIRAQFTESASILYAKVHEIVVSFYFIWIPRVSVGRSVAKNWEQHENLSLFL